MKNMRNYPIWTLLCTALCCCSVGYAQAQRTATAVATTFYGFVVNITVTDGGSGYVDAPAVTVTGGSGSGASAIATITNGSVNQVIVTAFGSGYTNVPMVVIDPPAVEDLTASTAIELNISTLKGKWYQLQNSTNLTNWTAWGNPIAGNGKETNMLASTQNAPNLYWRLTRITNAIAETFVWISPGMFTMGSPSSELGHQWNESPLTSVTISKGFWMGKTEVTQREYQAVMDANPSIFKNDLDNPVEMVSWYDATNYCAKLTVQERAAGRLPTGFEYRLPTEAQWEYACRAGTTTRFSYGDDLTATQLGDYAWYSGNSSQTQRVGQKKPNAWGLYDMSGNVWEWCLDSYYQLPGGNVTDPFGTSSGRSPRGSSWAGIATLCRSAVRGTNNPGDRMKELGFRVVLTPVN